MSASGQVGRLFDALWRALVYGLMPRVVLMTLLPLAVLMVSAGVLAWLYWEPGVEALRALLEESALLGDALRWLSTIGLASLRALVVPLLLVALVMPVLIVLCLWVVAQVLTPALVRLVVERRFPALERRRGASVWHAALRATGLSLAALLLLALTLPLWLVPPLGLVLPPLIWGWLAMQMMAFDVLADHADAQERRALLRSHRWPLLAMGVVSGLLGAAPAAVWALGALTLVLAPLVMMVSIWIYTLVFVFSALWFAHYLLAALHTLRQRPPVQPGVIDAPTLTASSP